MKKRERERETGREVERERETAREMDELDSGGGQSGGDNNNKAVDADNDDGTTPIPDRV